MDVPAAAGTIKALAGGYCDGERALQASISPNQMVIASDGALWWLDDDADWSGSTSGGNWGRHGTGSLLVRRLGSDGRVRTVSTLIPPVDGRAWRQNNQTIAGAAGNTLASDGHGGILVDVETNNSDRSFGFADVPNATAIVDINARGNRKVVLGGRPETQTNPDFTLAAQPASTVALGVIRSFARDRLGGIYFVDSYLAPGQPLPSVHPVVRYANLSTHTVTFYRNTAWQETVNPGEVATIAGLSTNQAARQDALFPPEPVRAYWLHSYVDRIRLRGQMLYVSEVQESGLPSANPAASFTEDQSTLDVLGINLGFDGSSRTVNGVSVPAGDIARLAGNLTLLPGYSCDGIPTGPSTPLDTLLSTTPAQLAQFDVSVRFPFADFEVGANGDLYIADTFNSRIRRVDGRGQLSTVAGGAIAGFNGDGPATARDLWFPADVTWDPIGNLLIADYANERIRELTPRGTLRTIVGRGPEPCGTGEAAVGRNRFAGALLAQIRDVAEDSRGDIFIADGGYNDIRAVDPSGRQNLTIGRTTPCAANDENQLPICPLLGVQANGTFAAAGFADPMNITVDAYDNLYVSDVDEVRYVNVTRRAVSVLGRTVPARSVGTVFALPNRMVHITTTTPGGVSSEDLPLPLGQLTVDGQGQLYVADPIAHIVYRVNSCGLINVVAGNGRQPASLGDGDGGSATAAAVAPLGIAYNCKTNLLLIDDGGPSTPTLQDGGLHTVVRAVNLGTRPVTEYGRAVDPSQIQTIAGLGPPPAPAGVPVEMVVPLATPLSPVRANSASTNKMDGCTSRIPNSAACASSSPTAESQASQGLRVAALSRSAARKTRARMRRNPTRTIHSRRPGTAGPPSRRSSASTRSPAAPLCLHRPRPSPRRQTATFSSLTRSPAEFAWW